MIAYNNFELSFTETQIGFPSFEQLGGGGGSSSCC